MFYDKKKMCFVKATIQKNNDKSLDHSMSSTSESWFEEKATNIAENFVGTAEYVSPEALSNDSSKISQAVDLWALGCIIYLFFHEQTPFKDKTDLLTFDRILNKQIIFSEVKI